MLPIFATLEPLEKVSQYTPLGIRFWDIARDRPVTHGLVVTARPPGQPSLERRAFRTISGVYAFRGLPGLHSLERSDAELPAGLHPIESSPPLATRFVVDVVDLLERFLPVTFQVDLPYRGIFPAQSTSGSTGLPGFFLFSAPSCTASSGLAEVRAQLVERLGSGQFRPAAYAVLEVEPQGRPASSGVADDQGRVAVLFPYPPFATVVGPFSPPPGPPETRIQSWEMVIRARFRPASQTRADAAARWPDLGAVLTQPVAAIWHDQVGPGQTQLASRLVFGQPLVLRTAGISELWLEP